MTPERCALALQLYTTMVRIRRFGERKEELFSADELPGFVHLSIGQEACRSGGFGAELAALIGEELFDWRDAPIARVAAADVPLPFSPPLERAVLPQVDGIVTAARMLSSRE
jgi:Transketolase, C-terminal domain